MWIVLAGVNYALAGLGMYLWAKGGEHIEINLGAAVFSFGIAQICIAMDKG